MQFVDGPFAEYPKDVWYLKSLVSKSLLVNGYVYQHRPRWRQQFFSIHYTCCSSPTQVCLTASPMLFVTDDRSSCSIPLFDNGLLVCFFSYISDSFTAHCYIQ